MVMSNWKGEQLCKFLEGQNRIKKILTAGKMQKKYSGIYNSKQFSAFSSLFERVTKENAPRLKPWICSYFTKHCMEAQVAELN